MKKVKAKYKISSKAKTLETLMPIIKNAKVLPLIRFSLREFIEKEDQIISSVKSSFQSNIIVRSSSSNEDNLKSSNAGGFSSILDVDINSDEKIKNVIEENMNFKINRHALNFYGQCVDKDNCDKNTAR